MPENSPELVRDLMTVGVPTCKNTTPVVDVARFLIENNVEELVVLGEEGEGIGVCGYRELVNAYERENVRELNCRRCDVRRCTGITIRHHAQAGSTIDAETKTSAWLT